MEALRAVILYDPLPPPLGLALEDMLLESRAETILVWRHQPSIIAGRSTPLEIEVDCRLARKLGVPVFRRRSGGGAVYHDQGNINISLVVRGCKRLYPGDVYWRGLGLLLRLLGRLGFRAWVENNSDIVVEGWKVSGSAALIRGSRALYHATLLVEADVSVLRMLTLPRWELVAEGRVTPAKYRPRNLSSINPNITLERVLRELESLLHEGGAIVEHTLPASYLESPLLLERYPRLC